MAWLAAKESSFAQVYGSFAEDTAFSDRCNMEVKMPSFLASIWDIFEEPSQFQNFYGID